MRRLALTVMALLAALPASAASADTLLVADPTAANVTVYGRPAAWWRRADDGTFRLVVRNGGEVADAPVPTSGHPFDPDLGPTSGNRRVVVSARDGALYRYDVGAGGEQKIAALSSSATDRAPSFFKDAIAFSRTDGPRPGWYLARPGRALKRLGRDGPPGAGPARPP